MDPMRATRDRRHQRDSCSSTWSEKQQTLNGGDPLVESVSSCSSRTELFCVFFPLLQWGVQPDSGRWDWAGLKAEIKKHGLRNSLLLAPMPTASTSQILGNNEVRTRRTQAPSFAWTTFVRGQVLTVSVFPFPIVQCFEPYTSNIYVRRTLAGEFVCVSRHLLQDLIELGLWTPELKNKIIAANGSIATIEEIPADIRALYKTVWEVSQKTIINMAADRGVYIDQVSCAHIQRV